MRAMDVVDLAPGAYLVSGHGITQAECEALLAASRAFFALPRAQREAVAMLRSPHFRGYNGAGSERTGGIPDLREQLDVGLERAAEAGGPGYRRLHGPNQWPAALPAFGPRVLNWMARLRPLAERVLAVALARAGVAEDALAATLGERPHERLKIVRYPGVPERAGQGVGAHSDSGLITMILQDGEPGLQVRVAGDGWTDVAAPPGSFVAVAGRAAASGTGGRLPAAVHRVVSPPAGAERISIPYFLNPDMDAVIDGTAYGWDVLEVMLLSHPEPARRHHPDLVAQRERRLSAAG